MLSDYVVEAGVRQFLLKNLTRTPDGFAWKINLPVLANNISNVGLGLNHNYKFDMPSLFVRGGKSDYVLATDINQIHSTFKNSMIKTIENAGHWLHAEQPKEFFDITTHFFNKN